MDFTVRLSGGKRGDLGAARESTRCSCKRPKLSPSIHMEAHNHLQLQFQGIQCLPLTSSGTKHEHGTHTYMQAKHSRIKQNGYM